MGVKKAFIYSYGGAVVFGPRVYYSVLNRAAQYFRTKDILDRLPKKGWRERTLSLWKYLKLSYPMGDWGKLYVCKTRSARKEYLRFGGRG